MQLAVNRQPGYRQGTRRAAELWNTMIINDIVENLWKWPKIIALPRVVLRAQAMDRDTAESELKFIPINVDLQILMEFCKTAAEHTPFENRFVTSVSRTAGWA